MSSSNASRAAAGPQPRIAPEAEPSGPPIFVFGSNLAGRHGKGAALWARQNRGAIYGQGAGRQGLSYAIPTKDKALKVLALDVIDQWVGEFLIYARSNPDLRFQLTPIGCGLAGYSPRQIGPMFAGAPANVIQPPEFLSLSHAARSASPPPVASPLART